MRRPADLLDWVNEPLTEQEYLAMQACVTRGQPYGTTTWQKRTAKRLGIESSLKPIGRPKAK